MSGRVLVTVAMVTHRDGCKPFVEIFVDGERVHTSCTKENMDKLRYRSCDSIVTLSSLVGRTQSGMGVSRYLWACQFKVMFWLWCITSSLFRCQRVPGW